MRPTDPSQMVLERDSSVLGYPGEISKALDADHHGVCKFDGPEDPLYVNVRNVLMSLVSKFPVPGKLYNSHILANVGLHMKVLAQLQFQQEVKIYVRSRRSLQCQDPRMSTTFSFEIAGFPTHAAGFSRTMLSTYGCTTRLLDQEFCGYMVLLPVVNPSYLLSSSTTWPSWVCPASTSLCASVIIVNDL